MKIYWTKINEIIDESPDIKTFYLEQPADFTWDEGAHTHMAMQGFNAGEKPNKDLVRHMSISTLPHEKTIGITTRIKSHCSEYKSILKSLEIGSEVALFKTHSNVPLKREDNNVYLLSSGVGLATFRPLVLEYLDNPDKVANVHSLNIDSKGDSLFPQLFNTVPEKRFTAEFVDNRQTYYETAQTLASDKQGLFYVVGSDEFLRENIAMLREAGISPEQIMLDKREGQLVKFFPEHVK